MQINIIDLERVFACLIQKLKDGEIAVVETDSDFYWNITTDEWGNFDSPPQPAIGSLVDDWKSLEQMMRGKAPTTYLDFERLASILRLVSETVVPSLSDEEAEKLLREEFPEDPTI